MIYNTTPLRLTGGNRHSARLPEDIVLVEDIEDVEERLRED